MGVAGTIDYTEIIRRDVARPCSQCSGHHCTRS